MKKYRISESEHFNLMSMYDHLKCIEIDFEEAPAGTHSKEEWDGLEARIQEVEDLLEAAPCVGAAVDYPALKQIRKIKDERQMIRYCRCLEGGASEKDAALAFEL